MPRCGRPGSALGGGVESAADLAGRGGAVRGGEDLDDAVGGRADEDVGHGRVVDLRVQVEGLLQERVGGGGAEVPGGRRQDARVLDEAADRVVGVEARDELADLVDPAGLGAVLGDHEADAGEALEGGGLVEDGALGEREPAEFGVLLDAGSGGGGLGVRPGTGGHHRGLAREVGGVHGVGGEPGGVVHEDAAVAELREQLDALHDGGGRAVAALLHDLPHRGGLGEGLRELVEELLPGPVVAARGERADALGAQLLRGGEEFVGRPGDLAHPGLLEQVGVVPDGPAETRVRQALGLAAVRGADAPLVERGGLDPVLQPPLLDVLVDGHGDPGVLPPEGLVVEVDDDEVGGLPGGDGVLDLVVDVLQSVGRLDLDAGLLGEGREGALLRGGGRVPRGPAGDDGEGVVVARAARAVAAGAAGGEGEAERPGGERRREARGTWPAELLHEKSFVVRACCRAGGYGGSACGGCGGPCRGGGGRRRPASARGRPSPGAGRWPETTRRRARLTEFRTLPAKSITKITNQ
ncbi:putative secreted solute-binding lipoprotein [Streptomyces sp. Tu6071]|nr:putative secreted solute-binding lipoprotein [Streptomyces sp. Tu6071]